MAGVRQKSGELFMGLGCSREKVRPSRFFLRVRIIHEASISVAVRPEHVEGRTGIRVSTGLTRTATTDFVSKSAHMPVEGEGHNSSSPLPGYWVPPRYGIGEGVQGEGE